MRRAAIFGFGLISGMAAMYFLLAFGVLRVPALVRVEAVAEGAAHRTNPQTASVAREQHGPVAQPMSPPGDLHGRLTMPVLGAKPADLLDTFEEKRGEARKHEAVDIIAPRGTPVVAVEDGVIRKLFNSKPGGLTIYHFDEQETYCYYYAHLDRYADGLVEGQRVHRGEVIGYVGTTGNAPPGTPHLHFAIFRLGPEKRWWEGTPVNPYPVLAASSR
jgi:murein DD-endopeptidase MepM/ murein hydrolase activator NlpD